MTGEQIVSVLQEQCQPLGSSRPFLHLGVSDGFTYDLAKTIVAGNCTSITVSNVKLYQLGLSAPPQDKPPPVREILRVAEYGESWGVPADWE